MASIKKYETARGHAWRVQYRSPAAHDLEVTEKILGVWLELYERQTV